MAGSSVASSLLKPSGPGVLLLWKCLECREKGWLPHCHCSHSSPTSAICTRKREDRTVHFTALPRLPTGCKDKRRERRQGEPWAESCRQNVGELCYRALGRRWKLE